MVPPQEPVAGNAGQPDMQGVLVQLPAVAQKFVRGLPALFIGKGTALSTTGSRMGSAAWQIWLSRRSAARSKSLTGGYRSLLLLLHRIIFDRAIERLFFRPTRVWVRLARLHIPSAVRARGRDHFPTPRLTFEWAMSAVADPLNRFVFIDYGAGRGRALLMACSHPFEKAIGVEVSEELANDCRMNIAQFPRSRMLCRDVECICTDMMDFTPPPQDAVHFFLDPVEPEDFLKVVDRISASNRSGRNSAWIVSVGMNCDAEIVVRGYVPVPLPAALRLKAALFSPYRIALFRSPPADAAADVSPDT